jgi:hypothetical protein
VETRRNHRLFFNYVSEARTAEARSEARTAGGRWGAGGGEAVRRERRGAGGGGEAPAACRSAGRAAGVAAVRQRKK